MPLEITPQLDDVLSLFALTMFADKRVLSSEISVFVESSLSVQASLGMLPSFSEAILLEWFDDNRKRLRLLTSHETFEPQINALFERLSSLSDKQPLLDRMHQIAQSDDELHVSEVALSKLADRYWGPNDDDDWNSIIDDILKIA